jgi:hypothetical protein
LVAPSRLRPANDDEAIPSFAEQMQQAALPMGLETIIFVVIIVLIVLFVTGYFGRGRIKR